MTNPVIVIEVDPRSPQAQSSPFMDYSTVSSGDKYDKEKNKSNNILKPRIKEWRRNRKSQMVDINEYADLNRKYEEAKQRISRMRQSSANNRKMLLEMSSVINALKDISIEYDHDETAATTPIQNVQKKIRAIDAQLRAAMLQCGHLEQEKELQSTMIQEQEEQIKMMEERIKELQEQSKKSLVEKKNQVESEKKALIEMTKKGEMTNKIEVQQAKIAALEDEVRIISIEDANSSALHQKIQALNGSNQAKYLEIQEMERKLAILRDAQKGLTNVDKSPRSSKHVSFVPETFSRRNSLSSSSSCTGQSTSLESVVEENSDDEDEDQHEDDDNEDGIYSDDRGSSISSRSFSTEDSCSTTKDGDQSASIKISTSEDDSVEIMVGRKGRNIDVSDVSYTTEESVETETLKLEQEYHEATRIIGELREENAKLRNSHCQTLSNIAQISELTYNAEQTKKECDELKRALETQQQSAKQATNQYDKLREDHAKTLKDLEEERARYAQLMQDYSNVSHRQTEIEKYEKLQVVHDALVMKVGDMAEENENLIVQLNEARKERDQADSKVRQLASEVDAVSMAYKELQTENDALMDKFTKTSEQADSFKTKYYELLANDENAHTPSTTSSQDEHYETLRREYEAVLGKLRAMESMVHASEKQKREYTEALSKIQILEECNKELEQVREKFHTAESQVTLLKKENAKKTEEAKLARKREEQRVCHLKDMLSHYKVLENEHEEVCQKLQRLQALVGNKKDQDSSRRDSELLISTSPESPAGGLDTRVGPHNTMVGYEQRIKELQKQKNNALQELSKLEDELSQARLEKVEAAAARKDREQDLKVLLEHYHSLQRENESLKTTLKKMEEGLLAEEETRHSSNTDDAVLVEKKGDEEEVEEGYTAELESDNVMMEQPEEPNQNLDDDRNNDDTICGDTDIVSEAPTVDDAVLMDTKIGMTIANDPPVENKTTTNTITATANSSSSGSSNSTREILESKGHPQKGGETTAEVKGADDDDDIDDDDDDEDTVTRLLIDMALLKRRKEERLVVTKDEEKKKDSKSDASSVSNVSEGLSMDNSVEPADQDEGSALSDEAPSTSWKDTKIANLLQELDKAKGEIWVLEQREKTAQAEIARTEEKLMMALRESDEAKKRQIAKDGHLRDAVAQQKRLESECQQIQQKVASLVEQLEQARKDARLREEETKAARKRAAEYHTQCKKLEEKHDAAMKLIQDQVRQIERLEECGK